MAKPPINQQLDLLFLQDEGASSHFVFSITFECNTGRHDKCKISKCYCLCHYRQNRAGNWVRLTKSEIETTREEQKEREWQRVLESGKLPGETPPAEAELGFTCSCGEKHEYDAYVYQHWYEAIEFYCRCKSGYSIKSGVVTKLPEKPKPAFVPKIRKK